MSEAATPAATPPTPSTVTEFVERHQVHRAFVPFEFRSFDMIDVLAEIRAFVEDLPETRALFYTTDVYEETGLEACQLARFLEPCLNALGAWRSTAYSSPGKTRWVNPNYAHLPGFEAIDEPDERRAFLERVARIGLFEPPELTDQLGVETARGVLHTIDRLDVDYHERRAEGRRRLARSWKLAHEWGHTNVAIAEAFGRPTGTVSGWQAKYARDFDVPADPSGRAGFKPGWRDS